MSLVICYLSQKTVTNIPRQKEGKYFTSKEQKDNATIKKKVL